VSTRRDQVVAAATAELEELLGHDGTHLVAAGVAVECATVAVAERAGGGVFTARFERLAVDVAVSHDCLGVVGVGGHDSVSVLCGQVRVPLRSPRLDATFAYVDRTPFTVVVPGLETGGTTLGVDRDRASLDVTPTDDSCVTVVRRRETEDCGIDSEPFCRVVWPTGPVCLGPVGLGPVSVWPVGLGHSLLASLRVGAFALGVLFARLPCLLAENASEAISESHTGTLVRQQYMSSAAASHSDTVCRTIDRQRRRRSVVLSSARPTTRTWRTHSTT
jgi:hypothetical protein